MNTTQATTRSQNPIHHPKYKDFFVDLYGEDEYQTLNELDVELQSSTRKKSNKTVFLLHGITGSSLGDPDQFLDPFDVIWISPFRMIKGDLKRLKFPDTKKRPIVTHGFLPFGYNRFCSTLGKRFNIIKYAYDWRKPLSVLGQELSDALEKCKDKDISIVAHSMGGLVVRAALDDTKKKFPNVKRIITLGTPHRGSYAPLSAIRGTGKLLRKVARIIPSQTAEDIAKTSLRTMPGFYDLLPFDDAPHLYQARNWPKSGPRPMQRLLDESKSIHQKIAGVDDRFTLIIGNGTKTLVGAKLSDTSDQFDLSYNFEGDGSVPFDFAHPKNKQVTKIYYTDAEHGAMPGNKKILEAVIDIIGDRPVKSLSKTHSTRSKTKTEIIRSNEVEYRADADAALDQFEDDSAQSLVAAMSDFIRIDEPPETTQTEAMSVQPTTAIRTESRLKTSSIDQNAITYYLGGEMERRPFELNLFSGDIREADCRAYAFGIYEGVHPGGAGSVLNQSVDGQISEMFERGMLDARVGGITILPVSRRLVRAEYIIMVGLGLPDGNQEAVTIAAQNLVRYLIKTRTEDCALVLMGSMSGLSTDKSLRDILSGCFMAIADEPDSDMFRGLTICEYNDEKFVELQECAPATAREAANSVSNLRLTLHQKTIKASKASDTRKAFLTTLETREESTVFITAKLEKISASDYELKLNMLGDEALASTQEISHNFKIKDFDELIQGIREGTPPGSRTKLNKLGTDLTNLIFSKEIREVYNTIADHPIVVQQNELATRIPWEILPTRPGYLYPALEAGLSRHLMIQSDSISKHSNQGRHNDDPLSVLIIGDPTSDLDGADIEAKNIYDMLRELDRNIPVTYLRQGQATKSEILRKLRNGRYDILHYAGHAAFEEDARWRSGIICAGGEVMTGRDLTQLTQLPTVMLFNACESAKVRKKQIRQIPDYRGSFAEAAIRAGISHYIGTYWNVGDKDAVTFAKTFYDELSKGEMIGTAIVRARQEVKNLSSRTVDWLNYIHYGNRRFRMKLKR